MRCTPLLSLMVLITACSKDEPRRPLPPNLIFVAVEGDGALAVLDSETGELLRTVDLSREAHGAKVAYHPHNVQVTPDGRRVWLTGLPEAESGDHSHGGEELIGVDVGTLAVVERIPLGEGLHVAHVVVRDDTAYVTATDASSVLVVDLALGSVERSISLPPGAGPHGARLTADGTMLIIAGMGAGSMHVIDTTSDAIASYALPGRAVQAAVLPDDSAAFVTIYDTRQLARLALVTRELTLVDLPVGSAGPVQIYPSRDSASVWVADQGFLGGAPAGDQLVEIDAVSGAVRRSITVDPAPHGVVVNDQGTRVWTTTLVNGTVQAIDVASGVIVSTTPVGSSPNGISSRHPGGAMP